MLLRRFRDTDNAEERDMILYGLSIFANDQMSIQLLVREGLICTLMQRMSIELNEMSEDHAVATSRRVDHEKDQAMAPKSASKRKNSFKVDGNSYKKPMNRLSPSYSDGESPENSSGYSSVSNRSPNYSNFSSPKGTDFDSDEESDSYSPVCSDNEEDGNQEVKEGCHKGVKSKEMDSTDLGTLYGNVDDEEEKEPEALTNDEQIFAITADDDETTEEKQLEEVLNVAPELKQWNQSSIKKMLVLLRDMRLRIKRVPDLAKNENLVVLLRACKSIPEPAQYCQQILTFIVQ